MNIRERPEYVRNIGPISAHLVALGGVPMVRPGDDLTALVLKSLAASHETLRDGDILIIAQKIVSKAQNRFVHLRDVSVSPQSEQLARTVRKDARLVELILRESTEIVRCRRDVLIVAHKLGPIMANAGIDLSNVDQGADDGIALLLPENPDRTCRELCNELQAATGAKVGVIINDSHGRAFRNGTVGVAIGAAGVRALQDLRGVPDLYQRPLQSTEVGLADEIASAASLLMGQAGEGRPIVLARGILYARGDGCANDLVRPKEIDLFRSTSRADVAGAISERRSIRRYTDRPVAASVIHNILQAAGSAPSAHNRQPWRFVVLKNSQSKERLAQAMGERLRADRTRDGDAPEHIEADASQSIARITGAPVVILVCLTMETMDNYPDARRAEAEHLMAVQSTAMAMQNILLSAHAAGLGASIMCAPLFCQDTARTALDLPKSWEPQALITLGFPANAGKPYRRRPFNEIVRILEE